MVMPLLAFGSKPVHQQREVEIAALRAHALRVSLERGEVILEDHLRFIEQPSDQRRLAVVDAAAGDEAQKVLRLLGGQVVLDGLRIGSRRRHQK